MSDIHTIMHDPELWAPLFGRESYPEPTQLMEGCQKLKVQLSDAVLGGYLFELGKSYPTISIFHGCGDLAKDYIILKPLFHGAKTNYAVFDYRGFGFSTGKPTMGNIIEDALPCYQYLEQFLINNNYNPAIFVFGRSTGCNPICEIGQKSESILKNCHGFIFDSSFAYFLEFIKLVGIKHPLLTEENFAPYSNHVKLPHFSKPTLIMHGGRDFIATPEQSEAIYSLLPENIPKKRYCIEKGDHDAIVYERQRKYYLPVLSEFIEQYK